MRVRPSGVVAAIVAALLLGALHSGAAGCIYVAVPSVALLSHWTAHGIAPSRWDVVGASQAAQNA